jgi:hypothetical protein
MTLKSVPVDKVAPAQVRRDQWGRYLIVPPDATKPVGYTRVTTVAKALDSGGGLAPWKATMTAAGIIMRRGLRAQWEALLAEHGDPWYGSEEAKAECKRLVEECAAVGGANDRREMGSALHSITAMTDLGAEPLHLTDETKRDVETYRTGMALSGIDMDYNYVERVVVLDDYHVAGTFDRVCVVPGFDLPLIADLKTGADLSYSWGSIAVQLSAYAHADAIYEQGTHKDGSKDVRVPMPDVNQEWGLVIHLNAGAGTLELWLVDLDAGWAGFESSLWARDWRARKDLAVPLSEFNYDVPDAALSDIEATQVADLMETLSASVVQAQEERGVPDVRTWLQARIEVIGAHEAARTMLQAHWPPGLPTLRASHMHTSDQLATIEHLLDGVERAHNLGWPEPRPSN